MDRIMPCKGQIIKIEGVRIIARHEWLLSASDEVIKFPAEAGCRIRSRVVTGKCETGSAAHGHPEVCNRVPAVSIRRTIALAGQRACAFLCFAVVK